MRALTEKRDRIVAAIREHFSDDDVIASGEASGTHIFLRFRHLRANATEQLLIAARDAGVLVYSGRPYYQRAPRHATLLLGYTTVATADITRGVQRLAAAFSSL